MGLRHGAMQDGDARLLVWNLAWASRTSPRGPEILARITRRKPDILCLTEALLGFLPGEGHVISSGPDYGYGVQPKRRKVLLWSRHPWRDLDPEGDPKLPPGRFVRGRTMSPAGELDVIGVCIPWKMAHVNSGQRNRRPWEDHLRYLDALPRILARPARRPVVLAGDFNQRIPAGREPLAVRAALASALEGFEVATPGPIPGIGGPAIDHVAHGAGLRATRLRGIPADGEAGRLSDHFGIDLHLGRAGRERRGPARTA